MVERLGEMRKEKRERVEKGSREGIKEKETKRQFKGGPERPTSPFLYQTLRCSHFLLKFSGYEKFIECIIKKNMSWCETECKICAIGETKCNET